jgi:hypothetical protein
VTALALAVALAVLVWWWATRPLARRAPAGVREAVRVAAWGRGYVLLEMPCGRGCYVRVTGRWGGPEALVACLDDTPAGWADLGRRVLALPVVAVPGDPPAAPPEPQGHR